ncbi:hypothetical protein RHGRI_022875 [Rhododendron griersonianum]|uniref:Uncharacterized protein n=1 Tax=Rhododendron griersonianum TaxID=479676 RepID=A0AAV6J643_9ERIC|nr:hypothetical protein RHGRI_022875 [Rhododendron griersonianum]
MMMARACDHQPHLPCLHCQPQSFITMVQHMIERCLLFHMTRDDCIRALAKNAGIQPLVTITVWEELVKENKGFFQAYHQALSPRNFNCQTSLREGTHESHEAATVEVNEKSPGRIHIVQPEESQL